MFEKTGNPDESWSLDDLAKYLRNAFRRDVVGKWWTGRAIQIACPKLKARGMTLEEWVEKEIGVSRTTAYRYRQIAEKFTHEDVQRKQLKELYEELGLAKTPEPAESEYDEGSNRCSDAAGGEYLAADHISVPHKMLLVTKPRHTTSLRTASQPAGVTDAVAADQEDDPNSPTKPEVFSAVEEAADEFQKALLNFDGRKDEWLGQDPAWRESVAEQFDELRKKLGSLVCSLRGEVGGSPQAA